MYLQKVPNIIYIKIKTNSIIKNRREKNPTESAQNFKNNSSERSQQ